MGQKYGTKSLNPLLQGAELYTELQKAPCFPVRFHLGSRICGGRIDANLGQLRQRLVRHYIDSTMGNRDQGEEVELLGRVHLVLFGVLQKEVIAALVAAGLAMRGGFDLDPGDPLAIVHQEIVLAVVADRDCRQ